MFWAGQGCPQVPREGNEPLYRQHAQGLEPSRLLVTCVALNGDSSVRLLGWPCSLVEDET